MLDEFADEFAVGEDIDDAEEGDADEEFACGVGGWADLVDERVGEPVDGGFEGGGAAGDGTADGALHEGVDGAGFDGEVRDRVATGEFLHEGGEGRGGGGGGEAEGWVFAGEDGSGFEEWGEVFGDFAAAAAGEETDEERVAAFGETAGAVPCDERVAGEDGGEPAAFIEFFFEGEDAEHEVEETRHFGDAAAVPCPDLGADVVDDAAGEAGFAEGGGEAEIEARVVDEDDGVGFEGVDGLEGLGEAAAEPWVFAEDLDETDDPGFLDPVADGWC